MAEKQADDFDAFESWLRSCPVANPPVGLLDRCLSTVPGIESAPVVAHPTRQRARNAKIFAAVGSAIAATVLVALLLGNREQSVFAQAIQQTTRATAVHILETFVDPERSPGELRTGEWWIRPDVGMRRVGKINGEIAYIFVKYKGQTTNWFPGENSVVIKPDSEPVGDLPYFTNGILALRKTEQMANDQKIRVIQQQIVKPGGKIRRFEIKDLHEGQQENAHLMLNLIVDIDDVTNRIVRKWYHEWAVGKDRENFSTLNATGVMEIDYPENLPESLFHVEYPADAKVTRTDAAGQGQ